MRIVISDLIIETTRKCNMSCEHCLRGDAQDMDMNMNYVRELLSQVDAVYNITFSGGEPSLNPNVIRDTLQIVKEMNIPVNSFYCVTNAKEKSPELLEYLNDWYDYTIENNVSNTFTCGTSRPITAENCDLEMNGLAISIDEFHEPVPVKNILYYTKAGYYKADDKFSDSSKSNIIARGRAEGAPYATQRPVCELYIDENEISTKRDNGVCDIDTSYSIDMLYLSCDGSLLADCDLSYKMVDEHKLGNIATDSLEDIISKHTGCYD